MRSSLLFWLGCAALAGGVLFHTSYRVQGLKERLADLNREIIREQEHTQILNADWSYLNDPSRLERLASQHLPLQPTDVVQLGRIEVVPMRQPTVEAPKQPTVAYAGLPAETRTAPAATASAPRAPSTAGAVRVSAGKPA